MAVTQNLKGTSYPSFKIHKQGPTFYQGTVAPNFVATNGDMYIQHGTGGAAWVYNEGWKILETGANDAVDVFEIYNSVRTSSKQVMYVLQGETTDATETELSPESTFSIDTTSLTLDSSGITTDSGSSIGKISIPTNSTGLVEARIVARDSNNNSNAGYIIKGIIVNDRGTTTLLTDPAEEIIGENTSEWYALIEAADNGSDSLKIKVSGSANARVRWTAFVTITLVTQEISLTVTDESGSAYSVAQGESLLISAASLLANDSSPGNTLSITGVQNPVGGTVTLNGTTIEFTSTGQAGQLASFQYTVSDGYGTQTGTVIITVTALNDVEAYMFNLQADADEARTLPEYIPPSVSEIFTTWARFDGANYYEGDDTNMSANANAWELLANPDRVNMPLNVEPANGFISPDSLENYTFEATLTSTDSDNDTNGLIVAFVRENGVNHVLALCATKAGAVPLSGFALVYFQDSVWYTDDGSYDFTILAQPNFGLDTSGGWSGSQIRLKIQRTGNIVKCYASQFNNTASYDANSEIIFDLSSNSNTQRFMGAQPYGYMTFSQPDSAYIDISVGGGIDKEVIYDAENNEVWDYNFNTPAWELSTDTAQDRLSYVRQVTNPNTTERFRVRETEIEYLGKSEGAVFDATRASTEIQNIYINSTTGGAGVGSGVEVIGLFEYDIEERNLLLNKPTLLTTSAYNNGNSVGSGTYFSDNNIDIDSLSLVDGTVVFADGTVGVITAITASSISYTVTTDFTIFDETI